MSSLTRSLKLALIASSLISTGLSAQLLGSGGVLPVGLPNLPVVGDTLRGVTGPGNGTTGSGPIARTLDSLGVPSAVDALDPTSLLDLRRQRLRQFVQDNRRTLELDERGYPVRRGELLVADPDPAGLAAARAAGFTILRDEIDPELGLRSVVLGVPRQMNVRDAITRLRTIAPSLAPDVNPIFEPAGGALAPVAATLAAGNGSGLRLAMIDGGVANHPSLARAAIEQRAFTGRAKATGHGTAIASLLVGSDGPFHGAAQGAQLFVADVYGGDQAAGSADAIVRALGWAASKRPSAITISLVGPPNILLQRAVEALARRGIPVIAAVGNDGPAAPPQYPASYPSVIAATAVDAGGRALTEAGRTPPSTFAAPGADMAAALPLKGYARVRGTSFAAPLVAARLAATGSAASLSAEAEKGKGRVGRGIVCGACRIDPKAVGAK